MSRRVRIVAPIPKRQQNKKSGTLYSQRTCPTAEHTTHHEPVPSQNTLLPHHGTPYSSWTCPTTEYPTDLGHSLPRTTLCTMQLSHRGTPYSPRTCLTAENPTHCRPAPPRNTLLTLALPHVEHQTHSTEEDLKKKCT